MLFLLGFIVGMALGLAIGLKAALEEEKRADVWERTAREILAELTAAAKE